MLQKLPVNNFEWIEDNLMNISLKAITKKTMKDVLSKLKFIVLKNYMNFIMIYRFYERMKIEKVKKLVTNLHEKAESVIHIRN